MRMLTAFFECCRKKAFNFGKRIGWCKPMEMTAACVNMQPVIFDNPEFGVVHDDGVKRACGKRLFL